jgi:hypothetical protein
MLLRSHRRGAEDAEVNFIRIPEPSTLWAQTRREENSDKCISSRMNWGAVVLLPYCLTLDQEVFLINFLSSSSS